MELQGWAWGLVIFAAVGIAAVLLGIIVVAVKVWERLGEKEEKLLTTEERIEEARKELESLLARPERGGGALPGPNEVAALIERVGQRLRDSTVFLRERKRTVEVLGTAKTAVSVANKRKEEGVAAEDEASKLLAEVQALINS